MVDRDAVLSFVRAKGMVLPVDVSKGLGINSLFSGAFLSELVSGGKIRISCAKIGGSPVYYIPEQHQKLEALYKYLNEKDKRAYDLLKQEGLLRDTDLTPLLRVSLRNIKDFAKPIEVTIRGEKEIFWRWYTRSSEEAAAAIKEMLSPTGSSILPKPEPMAVDEGSQELMGSSKKEAIGRTGDEKDASRQVLEATSKDANKGKTAAKATLPKKGLDSQGEDFITFKGDDDDQDAGKKAAGRVYGRRLGSGKAGIADDKPGFGPGERQTQIVRKADDDKASDTKKNEPGKDIDDDLHRKIRKFFNKKEIIILNIELIRRNSEIDYLLSVPSSVGRIAYFAKVKSKKKINDSDLASVYVKGQVKKLPAMLIITGEMTKKAQEMLGSDFSGLKVLKV